MLSSCDDSSEGSNSDSNSQFDGTYHKLDGYDSILTISGNTYSIINNDSINKSSTREIKYEYNHTFVTGNDFEGGKQIILTCTSTRITLLTDDAVMEINSDSNVLSNDPGIRDWKKGEPRDVYPENVGNTTYQIIKKTGDMFYTGIMTYPSPGHTYPTLWGSAWYKQ